MMKLNIFAAISASFQAVTTLANAVNRSANSLDNLSKLGEEYTDYLVKEQEVVNADRLKDLEAKAKAKYAAEKQEWSL